MMWVMALCFAIPLVLILIFSAGGKALGTTTWVVLGAMAVMMVAHFFMMGKSNKHSDKDQNIAGKDDKNRDDKDDKDHSGHRCCH